MLVRTVFTSQSFSHPKAVAQPQLGKVKLKNQSINKQMKQHGLLKGNYFGSFKKVDIKIIIWGL